MVTGCCCNVLRFSNPRSCNVVEYTLSQILVSFGKIKESAATSIDHKRGFVLSGGKNCNRGQSRAGKQELDDQESTVQHTCFKTFRCLQQHIKRRILETNQTSSRKKVFLFILKCSSRFLPSLLLFPWQLPLLSLHLKISRETPNQIQVYRHHGVIPRNICVKEMDITHVLPNSGSGALAALELPATQMELVACTVDNVL